MFAAVHFKDTADPKDKERRRSSAAAAGASIKPPIDPTTMVMSSFSKNVALLPPKQQALNFISLYFAQSNSQLPIFHREEFLEKYFIPIYGKIPENSTFASSNSSIDWSRLPEIEENDTWYYQYTRLLDAETGVDPEMDPFKFSAKVAVPRRFRKALYFTNIVFAVASSIWHLQFPGEISENFKNAALLHIEDAYSSTNRLESLQAMLCLTLYSLMRPCVPGVWYLSGSSLRLCIDLGLHNESSSSSTEPTTIDMRRRLFWCCYSLDRQICVYLGRPFGIPEESIKVPFPSILDDSMINNDSTMSSLTPKNSSDIFSYKHIALTMFKIRQLQAEIQSILYDQREIPRIFPSLSAWLADISARLNDWRAGIPQTTKKMNCEFTTEFFDLNYHHARMMLHGLAPARYVLTTNDFIKLAEASKETLFTFYKLWNHGALNYTWAVTQNVFMAHMNFLYAVFHNDEVKNATSLNEIRKLSGDASITLKSLINRCNAAEQCLEVLSILSQAVTKLKYPESSTKQIDERRENTPSSGAMNRIPSEEEVKTLQPGGLMTGNMRRLIVSIPELINAEENNKPTHAREEDTDGEDPSGQRKKPKLKEGSLDSPSIVDTATNTPTPNVGSLALNQEKTSAYLYNSNAENSWGLSDTDLDRFFEEVRKVDSPDSSRSYSHFSLTGNALEDGVAPDVGDKAGNTIMHSPSISASVSGSVSTSSPAVSSGSNRSISDGRQTQDDSPSFIPGTPQTLSKTLYKVGATQQHYSGQNQIQQDSRFLLGPGSQGQKHQPYTLYHNQSSSPSSGYPSNFSYVSGQNYQPHFQSAPTSFSPPSSLPAFPHPVTSAMNSPARQDFKNSDGSSYPLALKSDLSKRNTKEGQRVYKLMVETGTESIWDQFFAQPFKLDEI
ncbi:hypothetical protein PMKS-002815 [Pichia membranifaciens]|uniref:Xylanolytic transcriptional activator regulatory domain-containing protein n=1 Tax=Pichia membranifaciens TaxID=4926 RepID=A0A1Q2YIY4_9ASCO|nr:hypothetical protein PMKS-002815 [Pichia membranifaciens]